MLTLTTHNFIYTQTKKKIENSNKEIQSFHSGKNVITANYKL